MLEKMEHTTGLADFDAATSRSSAKRVAAVVSKFTDEKRKLVCEIGFGGILHMPQINKTPRKFTVWLLSKLDLATRSIVVNGKCKVKLTDEGIHRVLGIPCGSKKLVGLESNEVQEKSDFIKLAIGSVSTDPLETCSLKVAEDVVTMTYPGGMNEEQAERFKVAFVVFTIGHFLVAKTKSNHGVEDYWGSLMKTAEIHNHNFCSLVIDEIMESAKRVQDGLRMKHTVKNVTGCTLGLQVLYLDSLNLAGFSIPPDRYPRIALFDLVLLKKMINADQENNISYCNSDTSGNLKNSDTSSHRLVRFEGDSSRHPASSSTKLEVPFFRTPQPAVSTYLTAYLRGSIEQKLTYGQVDALKWHNARMIHHVRKTKKLLVQGVCFNSYQDGLQSIIEVHMEALMANIFQDNLSLSQKLHTASSGTTATTTSGQKRTSSFQLSSHENSITSEGQSSVRGVSSTGMEKCDTYSEGALVTPLVGKQLFHEPSSNNSKRIKLEMESSSSGPKKLITRVPYILTEEAINAIIVEGSANGSKPSENTVEPSIFTKLKCKQKRFAPSPWKLGVPRKVVTICVTNKLYGWLANNNSSTLASNWIVHALPKYIELDGYILKGIFIEGKDFTPEAFDIALRRMIQLDSLLYGPGGKLCWRHVMESDFAMLVLGNIDPLECISVLYQFTMMFNEYDISECRMIIIPALVERNWCAYYWDMVEYKVHVLDPTYGISIGNCIEEIHKQNIRKIQCSLEKIAGLLFEGWKVNWTDFKTNYVKPIVSNPHRAPGGIITLLAIQEFDGAGYVEAQTDVTIEEFTKLVLYEMVSLEGNYGKQPAGFIETINSN